MTNVNPLRLVVLAKLGGYEVQSVQAGHVEGFRRIVRLHRPMQAWQSVVEEVVLLHRCQWKHIIIAIEEALAQTVDTMQVHLDSTAVERRQHLLGHKLTVEHDADARQTVHPRL